MSFDNYKFIYFNIIIVCLLLTGNLLLLIIILMIKLSYLSNVESDQDYIFDFGDVDYEEVGVKYWEFDIDDEFIYTLMHEEIYLMENCYFFFDLYGGETILDYIDFIDFNIYKISDNRNIKYVYSNMQVYHNYINNYNYDLYSMQQNYLNNNNENYFINNILKMEEEEHNNYINNVYQIMNNENKVFSNKKKVFYRDYINNKKWKK